MAVVRRKQPAPSAQISELEELRLELTQATARVDAAKAKRAAAFAELCDAVATRVAVEQQIDVVVQVDQELAQFRSAIAEADEEAESALARAADLRHNADAIESEAPESVINADLEDARSRAAESGRRHGDAVLSGAHGAALRRFEQQRNELDAVVRDLEERVARRNEYTSRAAHLRATADALTEAAERARARSLELRAKAADVPSRIKRAAAERIAREERLRALGREMPKPPDSANVIDRALVIDGDVRSISFPVELIRPQK